MDPNIQAALCEIAAAINDEDDPGQRAAWLILADYLDEEPERLVRASFLIPGNNGKVSRGRLADSIRRAVARGGCWSGELSLYVDMIRPPAGIIIGGSIFYP